ncbi:MAG: RomA family MBL fold metallo-hydrolase, partial [Oxalobacter sp.]|nr:RomA family MBL fold metallo-hydrolase [Oxalobacter sp.]
DWYTALELEDGMRIHILPARHFSGRGLTRNKTLWVSFALESPGRRIYFSGDTGYGPHLAEIGNRFDGFDLAILENGQYDKRWATIHMMPEETAQAAVELKAKALLPAHSGKFSISYHAWDDPFIRIAKASEDKPYRLLTPVIGDRVDLEDETQLFPYWWEGME